MTHKEKAVNYFSQKLHCSQAVLAAFAKRILLYENFQRIITINLTINKLLYIL